MVSEILNPNAASYSVGITTKACGSVVIDGPTSTPVLPLKQVTGDMIADGSVGLADLAANSVDGSKIVDGSVSGNDILLANNQALVARNAANNANLALAQINADDTSNFRVDGGGGFFSVMSPAGYRLFVTPAGNVSIGTMSPVSKLDLVGGGIRIDGTSQTGIWNSRIPISNSLIAVDSAGFVGLYTSITIGTDGLPVVSYFDNTNGDLKVVKCGSILCIPNWTRR